MAMVGPVRLPAVATLVLLLLSGCTTTNVGDDLTPNQTALLAPPGPPEPYTLHGEGCHAVSALVPVDPETTDQWLPPGFTAGDAGLALGAPASTGKALLSYFAASCAAVADTSINSPTSWASLDVFVEPPMFPTVLGSDAQQNWYEVARYGTGGPEEEPLAAFDWPTLHAVAEMITTLPTLGAASTQLRNSTGHLATVSVIAPAPAPATPDAIRTWHLHNGTLSVVDMAYDTPTQVGIVACDFAAGSLLEQFFGRPDCGDGQAIGTYSGVNDIVVTWRHAGTL